MKTRFLQTSAVAAALMVLPGFVAAQQAQQQPGQRQPAQQAGGATQCT